MWYVYACKVSAILIDMEMYNMPQCNIMKTTLSSCICITLHVSWGVSFWLCGIEAVITLQKVPLSNPSETVYCVR